jgi:alcohol dehydrogenase class IV
VERLGAQRALVVTTPGRVGLGDRVAARDRRPVRGPAARGDHAGADRARPPGAGQGGSADADCLVAVGGGAATGLCKGIAYESELPIIAVPTTYSGSEMTGFCGMTIDGVKRMHESPAMLPSTVVYDAELSRSLPLAASAGSAMNALAHCVDAIYLPSLSPLLAPAAVEGARVVVDALPRLLAAPDDLEARSDMLYGAYLAGAALTGGFALQHAIAHMLGGSFGVEHGVAHAVVLPYVTAHLADVAPEPLGRIADAVGAPGDLPGLFWDLAGAAGLPRRLADVGMGPADLDKAVEIATTAEDHATRGWRATPLRSPRPWSCAILAAAAAGGRPR